MRKWQDHCTSFSSTATQNTEKPADVFRIFSTLISSSVWTHEAVSGNLLARQAYPVPPAGEALCFTQFRAPTTLPGAGRCPANGDG